MAKKLKDYYDSKYAELLADKLVVVWPKLDVAGFINYLKKNLKGKEFFYRQDTVVSAFEIYLTPDYSKNVAIFKKILGPELTTTNGMFTHGWWLWPVGRYVEKHGTKNFEVSMKFIYELTKRFTGEFAIRSLILQKPKKSFQIILKWSKDKNVHVRRLASEGVRIRLPWAKKSLVALEEFKTYKKILTNLKSDSEKFVQKSVGNNLNDLMKEDSVKAMEIISEWKKGSPTKETLWIIKHGVRSTKKI